VVVLFLDGYDKDPHPQRKHINSLTTVLIVTKRKFLPLSAMMNTASLVVFPFLNCDLIARQHKKSMTSKCTVPCMA
jgi:hypothetical protein